LRIEYPGAWYSSEGGQAFNEAPRSKLRGIEAEFAEANPPSHKASAGHLAIPPCSKLQGILAKANESGQA